MKSWLKEETDTVPLSLRYFTCRFQDEGVHFEEQRSRNRRSRTEGKGRRLLGTIREKYIPRAFLRGCVYSNLFKFEFMCAQYLPRSTRTNAVDLNTASEIQRIFFQGYHTRAHAHTHTHTHTRPVLPGYSRFLSAQQRTINKGVDSCFKQTCSSTESPPQSLASASGDSPKFQRLPVAARTFSYLICPLDSKLAKSTASDTFFIRFSIVLFVREFKVLHVRERKRKNEAPERRRLKRRKVSEIMEKAPRECSLHGGEETREERRRKAQWNNTV